MPLPIRDGNQSLTTLSTLIVNSAHVPAHTVVSLGSQAITDIAQAVSGVELGPNSISALEHISVTISAGTSITIGNVVSVTGGLTNAELRASSVTIGGSVQVSNLPATQAVTFGNIAGSVTAVISGTPSVTFGATTGSVSVLNFPSTQTVTFTQNVVTISNFPVSTVVSAYGQGGDGIWRSLKVEAGSGRLLSDVIYSGGGLSFPVAGSVTASISGTPSITFGTAVVTGSVQVSNFPATQSVSFGNISGSVTASISGTPSVTFSSIQVSNFPATQSVTFTTAPVTFGQAVVSASNIGDLLSSVAMDNTPDATTKFVKIGGHQSGSNQTSHIVHVSAGGSMSVDASGSSVTFTQASVTFSSITGSVSVLNFPATQTVTFTQASVTFGTPVVTGSVSVLNFPSTQTIAGTVTANVFGLTNSELNVIPIPIAVDGADVGGKGFEILVPDELNRYRSLSSGYPLPISGTVTANAGNFGFDENQDITVGGEKGILVGWYDDASGQYRRAGDATPLPISGTVNVGNLPDATNPKTWQTIGDELGSGLNAAGLTIDVATIPAISGTVTANVGSILDPDFTIANSIENAVNVSRVGLLAQTLGDTPSSYGVKVAFEGNDGNAYAVTSGNPFPISGTVTANALGTRTFVDQNAVTVNGFLSVGGWDSTSSQHAPIPLTDGGTGVRIGFDDTNGSPFQVVNHPSVPLSATVTVGNSVTIGSIPAISGTVTANIDGMIENQDLGQKVIYSVPVFYNNQLTLTSEVSTDTPLPISGTVTANLDPSIQNAVVNGLNEYAASYNDPLPISLPFGVPSLPISGTVTVGNSVTISSLPAISGTVTANVSAVGNAGEAVPEGTILIGFEMGGTLERVSDLVPLPVTAVGTVTVGAMPSGSLTTRFGSVVTANLAQISSAVTNASRKFLLLQNISSGVVTIGIGFSPTTTQGIQLGVGAGMTFDSFVPTGAVYWLGAVTGAAFTILEG